MDGTARLGDGARLFRRLRFGQLAELSMLDLRSYRSRQVEQPAPPAPWPDAEIDDADRTITGDQQHRWLRESLHQRRAQWKLIGNPVMIAPVNFGSLPDELANPVADVTGLLPRDGAPYNLDQWDGYTADRRTLFRHIKNRQVKDALFITGDIHSGWACELPYDASTYTGQDAPGDDSAGVEFVCSSVTSNNLKDITGTPRRTTSVAVEEGIKANNRHIKYLNFDDHGFSVLDLTAKRAQMDWFIISDRAEKDAEITHEISWATDSGTGKIRQVEKPVGA
jgi:alkaline phosphatase D